MAREISRSFLTLSAALLALSLAGCDGMEGYSLFTVIVPVSEGEGCAAGTVIPLADDQAGVLALALDATNVYWATSEPAVGASKILTLPKEGGTPTVVASLGRACLQPHAR